MIGFLPGASGAKTAGGSAIRTILVTILVLFAAQACLADTIIDGSSLNDQELLNLGIDPAAFLFTGNTMYDFNGVDELNIIAAEINPLTTSTLTGPVQSVTVQLADSSSANPAFTAESNSNSDTPEPGTVVMLALGALALFVLGRRWLPAE